MYFQKKDNVNTSIKKTRNIPDINSELWGKTWNHNKSEFRVKKKEEERKHRNMHEWDNAWK